MADLETAADTALANVKELAGHADHTHQAISELEEELSSVAAQLEAEWPALGEKLRSLLEGVHAHDQQLADRGEEVEKAVDQLGEAVGSAAAEAEQELAGAQSEVSTLSGQMETGRQRIAHLAEQVTASAASLQEAADSIQSQLEHALSDARELLGVDVVNGLLGLQEEIHGRSEALAQGLLSACHAAMEDKYDNWLTTLHDVEDLVRGAFDNAREHVTQVIDYSLRECAARHQEAIAELREVMSTVEAAAEDLAQAIGQRRAELDQAGTDLADGLHDTDAGVQTMTAALEGLKQLMAKFSFVQV